MQRHLAPAGRPGELSGEVLDGALRFYGGQLALSLQFYPPGAVGELSVGPSSHVRGRLDRETHATEPPELL